MGARYPVNKLLQTLHALKSIHLKRDSPYRLKMPAMQSIFLLFHHFYANIMQMSKPRMAYLFSLSPLKPLCIQDARSKKVEEMKEKKGTPA